MTEARPALNVVFSSAEMNADRTTKKKRNTEETWKNVLHIPCMLYLPYFSPRKEKQSVTAKSSIFSQFLTEEKSKIPY